MSLPKRKFREIVFQMLYSHDLATNEEEDIIPFMMDEYGISRTNMRDAYVRMKAVSDKVALFDEQIAEFSDQYDLDRIQRVERNILRLALYEMFEDEGIPSKVVIAEALRLAKKFSTPEAVHFVNAILDAIYKKNFASDEGEEDKNDIFFNGS